MPFDGRRRVPSVSVDRPASRSRSRTRSPQKSQGYSPSSAKPIPRARKNSTVDRVEGPSPLAQIFQPLVIPEGEESANLGLHAISISYGPAHRRRLSSMQSTQKRTPVEEPETRSQSSRGRPLDSVSGPRSPLDELSNETSHQVHPSEIGEPETVQQIEEEEENQTGVSMMLLVRLEDMEKRQKRIEDMLIQITNEMKAR